MSKVKPLTKGQNWTRRNWKKFVINPEGPKAFVNKEGFLERRLELDHAMDELNEKHELREVWDE